jgi:hypothetical protein
MNNNNTVNQIKFANYLYEAHADRNEKAGKRKVVDASKSGKLKKKIKKDDDLVISSEMVDLIERSLNELDEFGILKDTVGSHYSQPLDSSTLFFPIASKIESKETASAYSMPSQSKAKLNSSEYWLENSLYSNPETSIFKQHKTEPFHNSSSSEIIGGRFNEGRDNSPNVSPNKLPKVSLSSSGNNPVNSIQDFSRRLEILFLQRKSALEKSSGNLTLANEYMQKAINLLFQVDSRERSEIVNSKGEMKYEEFNLSAPTLSSNPHDILQTIDQQFFLYDPVIHSKASKIQRFYRKHLSHRIILANKLSRLIRGLLQRKRYNRLQKIRKQCALLVQRRFRTHLKRMHFLATKLKQWYKTCKIMKEYQRRLFHYQKARAIQRLFRGLLGRRKAALRKLRLTSAVRIQRHTRRFLLNNQRHFAISCLHRQVFLSVRKIQRTVRRVQAKQRCQITLLMEIIRNNLRLEKEKIVTSEMCKILKVQVKQYLATLPGRLHYYFVKRKLLYRKFQMLMNYNQRQPSISGPEGTLNENSFVSPQLISILSYYDEFSDGKITFAQFLAMLKSIQSFPELSEEIIFYFKQKLDSDSTNVIYLTDFLKWYDSEEADAFFDNLQNWQNGQPWRVPIYLLKEQFYTLTQLFSSFLRIHQLEEKLVIQEIVSKFSHDYYLSQFRSEHKPKFYCCQCHASFLLFSDYQAHFSVLDSNNPNTGYCTTTNLPAFYYLSNYHISHENWQNQTHLEHGISRYNLELQYIRYHSRKKVFESVNIWNNAKVKQTVLLERENKLSEVLFPLLLGAKNIKAKVIDILVHYVFLFKTPINQTVKTSGSDNHSGVLDTSYFISDAILHILSKSFTLPLRVEWIINERFTPSSATFDGSTDASSNFFRDGNHQKSELVKWFNRFLVINLPFLLLQNSGVDASYSDNANNRTLKELLPKETAAAEGYFYDLNSAALFGSTGNQPSVFPDSNTDSEVFTKWKSKNSTIRVSSAGIAGKKISDNFRTFQRNNRFRSAVPTFTKNGFFKKLSKKLSFVIVRLLSLLKDEMSSSLFSLLDFRVKFPRQ